MGTHKRIIITFLFVIGFIILLNGTSYAGTQEWNALNYDVTVNSDGSMDVVETWDIDISNTNTLFKDFDVDYTKYSGITNVKVTQVSNGVETLLTEIYEEQYHVDSGCYYGLLIDSLTFEIAWNVGLDSSSATRTYKVYYTITDAVKIYNDCTELYWQFLSTDNTISGKNVTGTIKLPQAVSDIEKLRVWAHGDLNGEIERTSEDTVTFSWKKLDANTMLEVRVVTEENIYSTCTNIYSTNELDSILEEEQNWADEANTTRNTYRSGIAIVALINLLIAAIYFSKIKKIRNERDELKAEYQYENVADFKYYREIPNEKEATPARASYLYNYKGGTVRIKTPEIGGNIFAGTILNLSLKGLLTFEPINEKEIKIKLTGQQAEISEDEEQVFDIIKKAAKGKGEVTTKELSTYTKKHYEEIHARYLLIEQSVDNYFEDKNYVDEERKKVAEKISKSFVKYILLFVFTFPLMGLFMYIPTYFIGLIATMVALNKSSKCIETLSEEGHIEKSQWESLKRYMEDYSLLKEKTVPDIILWEKYLVYATTFGISKKVIEQLKMVHPEMFRTDGSYSGMGGYWNVVTDPRFGGTDGFTRLGNSLGSAYRTASSAYSAAHSSSSSGSGGGGGSSGGGGGRPEVAVAAEADKPLIKNVLKRINI